MVLIMDPYSELPVESHVRQIKAAVAHARQVVKDAPQPTHAEFVKLIAAQAVIFQQASMTLLMESRVVVGQKQVTRLQLACSLASEANKAFKLVLPHLSKEQVIEAGFDSDGVISESSE